MLQGRNIAKEDFGMEPAEARELSQILLQESCAASIRECLSVGRATSSSFETGPALSRLDQRLL